MTEARPFGPDEEGARRPTPMIVAFHALVGGIGRSGMIANVALLLARERRRVLVVDQDPGSACALHRYLRPLIGSDSPSTLPGPIVRVRLGVTPCAGALDFLGRAPDDDPDDDADRAAFDLTREQLRDSEYDYVLIKTPPQPDSLLSAPPDVLMACHLLTQQAIAGTERLAREMRRADPSVRLLPVPMRVDERATAMLGTVRQRLDWLLEGMDAEERGRYWDRIALPEWPDYAEQVRPEVHSERRYALLQRYARVAGLLAETSGACVERVTVVHAAADRMVAEWVAEELAGVGYSVHRCRLDRFEPSSVPAGEGVAFIESGELAAAGDDPSAQQCAAILTRRGVAVVAMAVGEVAVGEVSAALSDVSRLTLSMTAPQSARESLFAYYPRLTGDVPDTAAEPSAAVRHPGEPSAPFVGNLSVRDRAPLGREDALDAIRDHFRGDQAQKRYYLTGELGVGKSELAVQYAQRFESQYDLIWLIHADTADSARQDLSALAEKMHLGGSRADMAAAALDALTGDARPEERQPWQRWLLVYIGVGQPDELEALLPPEGHGHVLLTSRAARPAGAVGDDLPPFTTAEAGRLLTSLVPDLLVAAEPPEPGAPSYADRIVAAVGTLPLAMHLAAIWIHGVVRDLLDLRTERRTAVAEAVTELLRQLALVGAQPASQQTADVGVPTTAMAPGLSALATLLIERLARGRLGNAAVRLLEICSCLSPSGVSLELLNSRQMRAALRSADPEMADPVLRHEVYALLARHGLLAADESVAALHVHPLALAVVRSRMSEPEREATQEVVRGILVSFNPADILDTKVRATRYAELQRHLEPSGAEKATDEAVREWLVDQVDSLCQVGDRRSLRIATTLGQQLVDHWRERLDEADNDPLLLRLNLGIAIAHADMGQAKTAFALSRETLEKQREVLGSTHLRTLLTATEYAAALRDRGDFGDFDDALVEHQSIWQAVRQALGEDHRFTLVALNNLAKSRMLAGDLNLALEDELANYEKRERRAADWGTAVPHALYRQGTLLRQLGRYKDSADCLDRAMSDYQKLVGTDRVNADDVNVLAAAASWAATRRRRGLPALRDTERAFETLHRVHGEDHPQTMSCLLSLAADLHADGQYAKAVEKAEECLHAYESKYHADHPFAHVCKVGLGTFTRGAGDLELAESHGRAAAEGLLARLGPDHPWTLAANLAWANTLVASGRREQAAAIEQLTVDHYRTRYGPDDVGARHAEQNLLDTRRTGPGRSRFEPEIDLLGT